MNASRLGSPAAGSDAVTGPEGSPGRAGRKLGSNVVRQIDATAAVESKTRTSLSGTEVPRVAVPRYDDDGELVRFIRRENLPGHFPFTAGVFPFKRQDEDPADLLA